MIGDKIFNFKKVLLEAGFFDELKKQFWDLDKFLSDNAEQLDKINEKDAKNRLIEFQRVAENIKTTYRKKLIKKTTDVLIMELKLI